MTNPHHLLPNSASPGQPHSAVEPANLRLKPQEIPFDNPASNCRFRPTFDKPFVATPAALAAYGDDIVRCLDYLCAQAEIHNGLDYLQVFESDKPEPLWFIEDGSGGAITALLPSDY